jgi:two-component system, chemotaxis family, CheB/CheR fusion protein
VRRFHFALNPEGFLFLGKSELLLSHANLFTPVSLKRRVFAKVVAPSLRDRLGTIADADGDHGPRTDAGRALREAAFDAAPVAQVVIARDGTIVQVNRRARLMLNVSTGDLGRPIQDVEASYRPVELRSHLQELYSDGQMRTLPNVVWTDTLGQRRMLEVQLEPLRAAGDLVGAAVTYSDLTEQLALNGELERAQRELSSAYEELQSTVEELETTNEELQSTNEELETTNEELQSTNEELETMNEELQSTNEELETINDELRERTLEVNQANAFMQTILSGLGVGIAVLDSHMRVRIWNRGAELLWGARADEVHGEHVLALDIGLPLEALRQPVREAFAGDPPAEPVLLDAVDRRGRAFNCRITVVPLVASPDNGSGVILLMERADAA